MKWFYNHQINCRWGSIRSERRAVGMPILIYALLLMLLVSTAWADDHKTAPKDPTDLVEIDLENLLDVAVTSASKKKQKLSAAAAAIYVITQEDIRRSGATSIPELLRMVPGL